MGGHRSGAVLGEASSSRSSRSTPGLMSQPSSDENGLTAPGTIGESRWTKGREWDGVGNWCDQETAEDIFAEIMRRVWENPDATVTQMMDYFVPRFLADKRAITHLDVKGEEVANYSFSELREYQRRIGSYLQVKLGLRPGDRVVLLYPPGSDFIFAFLGCMHAGVVPVPVYPPHPYRLETEVPNLNRIVKDSGCKAALTDSQYMMVIHTSVVRNMLSKVGLATAIQWPNIPTVTTDRLRTSYTDTTLVVEPTPKASDLAFLQYTSGSTSLPKGVMVTHGNLRGHFDVVYNQLCSNLSLHHVEHVAVSWLPHYHDMGLIGMLLTILWYGGHHVFMTPISFLQDPTQWLRAVHKYRGSFTGGPNFAFALAQRKTSTELRDSLDLSCLKTIYVGAEPIREQVLEGFKEYFQPSRLDPNVLLSSYGLAEFTLCATSQPAWRPLEVLRVDARVLTSEGRVVLRQDASSLASTATFVSVGDPFEKGGNVCRVVDPETRECVGEERVGEIWLDGPLKAAGYYNNPEKTAESFYAVIKGEEDSGRTYLRTGDQGFLYKGSLFITGRFKDLIILGGRNLYPQDIEYHVELTVSDMLRPGCSGAFSFIRPPSSSSSSSEGEGQEAVAIVAELRKAEANPEVLRQTVDRIRRCVADTFQVSLSAVVLVDAKSIPKTTSGKIQRHKCKEGYLNRTLKVAHMWEDGPNDEPPAFFASPGAYDLDQGDKDDIASQLSYLSAVDCCVHGEEDGDEGVVAREAYFTNKLLSYAIESCGKSREELDVDTPLGMMGLDSAALVALAKVAGDWVGKELSPIMLYKYGSIRKLSEYLARGAPEENGLGAAPPEDVMEPDMGASVAIVGIGLKVGGGARGDLMDKDAFWKFVVDGCDAVKPDMPPDRKMFKSQKWPGAYLERVDTFDAAFFGVNAAEAAHLDYQQGLILETAWHAIEDAGMDPTSLQGRAVGVYMGAVSHEFAVLESLRGEASSFDATGMCTCFVANRLSHFLDVKGPSLVVDTGCSSSLVCLSDAVRDLRLGITSMALVGGVNFALSSESSAALVRGGFISQSSRTFDASASGYGRGEGCAVVLLKRLSRALADRDRVYAVVRGTAVGQDGRTATLTAPNPVAQESVVRTAFRDAGVDPHRASYVEAHGTGTRLGDSMELTAIGSAMAGRDTKCFVSSNKANFGHLEAAAGVMGLIHAAMVVYHGMVPRAIHFKNPTPLVDWDNLPLTVPTETVTIRGPLEDSAATLVAGVNSFGVGGTIVHVVLESLPQCQLVEPAALDSSKESLPLLLPISARTEGALIRLGEAYANMLEGEDLRGSYGRTLELCAGASTRRAQHVGFRIGAVGRSADELRQSILTRLKDMQPEDDSNDHRPTSSSAASQAGCECVFLYTGQGAGYMGMGRSLYEHNAAFRASVDECDAIFTPLLDGLSIVKEVILAPSRGEAIPTTLLVQPTLFAIMYAMTRLWRMAGVEPGVVMGYSMSEVTAAVVARCITLEEGARLICARAKAMSSLPESRGGMTVVFASQDHVATTLLPSVACTPPLEIAAVSGESCVTVAGPLEGLSAMEGQLESSGVRFVRLAVSHSFHSSFMDPALPAVAEVATTVNPSPPSRTTRFISTVTGGELTSAPDAQHWVDNVRKPVLFLQAVRTLLSDPTQPRVVIEMGPDAQLTAMLKRILPADAKNITLISSMTKARRDDEILGVTEALAAYFEANMPIRLAAMSQATMDLPLYPFEPTVFVSLGATKDVIMRRLSGAAGVELDEERSAVPCDVSYQVQKDFGTTYLLEEAWLPRVGNTGPCARPPSHVVFLCSDAADAEALASCKSLQRRSHTVVVPRGSQSAVSPSSPSTSSSDSLVAIDFLSETERLRSLLQARGAGGTAIVYVASGASFAQNAQEWEGHADAVYGESARLLAVLRCLAEDAANPESKNTRLLVVTTQAKSTGDADWVGNLTAVLWSMTKSALQEYHPSILATLVDLPAPAGHDQPALLPSAAAGRNGHKVAALIDEFVELVGGEIVSLDRREGPMQLAYRDGRWLAMRLCTADMERMLDTRALRALEGSPNDFPPPGVQVDVRPLGFAEDDVESKVEVADDGWYLVTGGMGGLGLHAATTLVRHGARRLILTSRSGSVASQYQADLNALVAMPGVQVHCVSCDVGDREAVMRLFADPAYGYIRGVVHCAGVLADGRLSTQGEDKLEAVWQGKVCGAIHLSEASMAQQRLLELFMLYGSSSAVLGSPAAASYAAANGALASLAALRRQLGLPCTCVQWGVWRGVGFAQGPFADKIEEAGFPSVTRGLGAYVLTTVLNYHPLDAPATVCCNPVDWKAVVQRGPEYMLQGDLSCFSAVKASGARKAQPLKLSAGIKAYAKLEPGPERVQMIEKFLTEALERITNRKVDGGEDLTKSGIDSMQVLELVQRIRNSVPVKMELEDLLRNPTVETMSAFLSSKLDEALEGHRSLPLSAGQEMLLTTGLGGSFLFTELQLPGGAVANQALLSAWRLLISRHALLRTTVDMNSLGTSPGAGAGCQRVVDPAAIDLSKMAGAIACAASVRDLSGLRDALRQAAALMDSVPPARLYVMNAAAADGALTPVFLAVSRLLVDRRSLRMLAGELVALYAAKQAGRTPQVTHKLVARSLVDDLRSAPKQPDQEEDKGSDKVEGSLSISIEGTESEGSEKEVKPSPVAFAGLSRLPCTDPAAYKPQVEVVHLSREAAAQIEKYAAESNTTVAAVILSAYAAALVPRAQGDIDHLSIAVDMEEGLAGCIGEVLGPMSVPCVLELPLRSEAESVHIMLEHTLDQLSKPAAAPTPAIDVLAELPAYSFRKASDEVEELGGSPPRHLLRLVVTASDAPDKHSTQYDLAFHVAPGYAMENMADFAGEVTARINKMAGPERPPLSFFSHKPSSMSKAGAALAGMLWRDPASSSSSSYTDRGEPPVLWSPLVALVQLLGMALMGTVVTTPVMIVWPLLQWVLDSKGLMAALALCPLAFHAVGLLMSLAVVVLRWVVSWQRIDARDYPVNSMPYLRWWFMTRLVALVTPIYMNQVYSSAIRLWWFRALGAKIGQNVRLPASAHVTDPDLLVVEDDAVVGKGARLVSSVVRNGVLHRGTVEIGRGAHVSTHAMMLPGSKLQDYGVLNPLSVAVEGDCLLRDCIYEGHPACFVGLRKAAHTQRGEEMSGLFAAFLAPIREVLKTLLAPALATVAAALTYPVLAALARSVGAFDFLEWAMWREGPLLLALQSVLMGIVPVLCLPTLIASMTLSVKVMLLPDDVLASMARSVGLNMDITALRQLFTTPEGVETLRQYLPSGVQLIGTPDSVSLQFVADGMQALRYFIFDNLIVPSATVYWVLGCVVFLALAFMLQGFILVVLTNLLYYVLLLCGHAIPSRYTRGGVKAWAHSLKVTVLRWTYDRFLRLFVGTELLSMWYRTLGARVGRDVMIGNTEVFEDPHLIRLADGAVIGADAALETQSGSSGRVATAPVTKATAASGVSLGEKAMVGSRAVVGPDVNIGDQAVVLPQSSVVGPASVDNNTVVMGIPAIKVIDRSAMPDEDVQHIQQAAWYATLAKAAKSIAVPLASCGMNAIIVLLAAYPVMFFMFWVLSARGGHWSLLATQASMPLVYVCFCALLVGFIVAQKWLLRGRMKADATVELSSLAHHALIATLVLQKHAATAALSTLQGSLWAPLYLRLLGAHVAWDAYINTLHIAEPDLLVVEGKGASLDADAAVMPHVVDGPNLRMKEIKMEEGARLGVAAVVLGGAAMGARSEVVDGAFLPPGVVVGEGAVHWRSSAAQGEEDIEAGQASSFVVMALKV